MIAEKQAKFPKGTYKVSVGCRAGIACYNIVNLCTGRQYNTNTLWSMIKDIEEDLTANKYPQNSVRYRTWGDARAVRPSSGVVPPMEITESPPIKGSTFIIKVLFRQNATWQGTIQWIEGRQTRQYRSVNELIRLMDEAASITPAEIDTKSEV